ncbi:estradiol 17-beta-dehydrogenase 8-like [Tigriopus californicus]|uniref:estradiol 17-beta-dehydrogenase 8-like n=1 Tax=Tigriopus californicus TaxID=6832 RepID=UPI0027DA214D|nr:estradiol 17-beta-dehydrogenase 8-like [Tigriopus californicus]|eukprot:TCALIF_00738-PB protein Name:"Similar to HSD17B8 Estradiol 17-beta-dehydrogenase 8 (Canis familiaris)" AED:0.03 eAED:0.03 QI:2974/1/1/1/0.62/0.66/9/1425/246
MLSGRLALVTGGGRGIGREVCKLFAREGARVAVADLDQDATRETLKEMGGEDNHFGVEADVASLDSIKNTSSEVFKKFGEHPSIVVNSAGITRDGYLLKMSEPNFDQVINVNLKGTFNVNQTFAAAMKSAKINPGSIINVASISGQVGNAGQTNYSASKAGVIGFTRSAAKELGKFGIRVNCIAPGFIQTPMTDTIPDHIKQMLLFQIPMGDFGKPEDIAEVAVFLASDRSRYMTGSILSVNGGLY